jgi:hypothetical protein
MGATAAAAIDMGSLGELDVEGMDAQQIAALQAAAFAAAGQTSVSGGNHSRRDIGHE